MVWMAQHLFCLEGEDRQFQELINSECMGNKLINIPIPE